MFGKRESSRAGDVKVSISFVFCSGFFQPCFGNCTIKTMNTDNLALAIKVRVHCLFLFLSFCSVSSREGVNIYKPDAFFL